MAKPGRLPENHPDEQRARAKLRGLSPEARRKIAEQRDNAQAPAPPRQRAPRSTPQPPAPPRRWG